MQRQVELRKSITWIQGAALTIGAVLGVTIEFGNYSTLRN